MHQGFDAAAEPAVPPMPGWISSPSMAPAAGRAFLHGGCPGRSGEEGAPGLAGLTAGKRSAAAEWRRMPGGLCFVKIISIQRLFACRAV